MRPIKTRFIKALFLQVLDSIK